MEARGQQKMNHEVLDFSFSKIRIVYAFLISATFPVVTLLARSRIIDSEIDSSFSFMIFSYLIAFPLSIFLAILFFLILPVIYVENGIVTVKSFLFPWLSRSIELSRLIDVKSCIESTGVSKIQFIVNESDISYLTNILIWNGGRKGNVFSIDWTIEKSLLRKLLTAFQK